MNTAVRCEYMDASTTAGLKKYIKIGLSHKEIFKSTFAISLGIFIRSHLALNDEYPYRFV